MTKQAFIQELSAALASIDSQARAEIIADINEHFAEGAAHGQTEEEICRNLGQPSQIAEQVLEEYKAFKTYNHSQYNHGIGDAISSALEAADIDGIVSSALQSAANATRAVANVFANMEDTPRDIEWGNDGTPWEAHGTADNTSRVRGGYEFDIEEIFTGISDIDIDLSLANVQLLSNPQSSDVRVTVKGRSRNNNLRLENKNGTLVIHQRGPSFSFSIFGFKSSLEVTVYVPSSFSGKIKTDTGAGNITATGIGGKLYFDTGAGNVNFKGRIANSIKADTGAGKVRIECQEAGKINLDTGAGSIDIYAEKILGDMKLSSGAGSIRLESHEVNGNITASSGAGSIRMYLPQHVNCRIKAQKPGIGSLKNNIVGNPDSPYTLKASTGAGSITLEGLHQGNQN